MKNVITRHFTCSLYLKTQVLCCNAYFLSLFYHGITPHWILRIGSMIHTLILKDLNSLKDFGNFETFLLELINDILKID
jgi:hypothetical protein